LANRLNLEVVAEGIENKSQLKFFESHNCHKYQGYYFDKPMPADKLEELIKSPQKPET
jgi:EAL domain-containing protein (putative c-di-GMP-specific phosphodiesterase class I)